MSIKSLIKEKILKKILTNSKKNEESKRKKKNIQFKDLFRYSNRLDRCLILLGFIVACISGGMYPILLVLFGRTSQILFNYMIRQNINNNNTFYGNDMNNSNYTQCLPSSYFENIDTFDSQMSTIVYLFVVFGFVSFLMNYLSSFLWNAIGEKQTNRIRNMLFKSLLTKQIEFYDKFSPGELNGKVTNNLKLYSNGIGDRLGDAISLFLKFLVFVLVAFVNLPTLASVFLPIVILITLSAAIMFVISRKYTLKETKMYENAGKIAQQSLSSIRTVYAFNFQKMLIEKYIKNLSNIYKIVVKKSILSTLFLGLAEFLFYSMFGLFIIYGIYLFQHLCGQPNGFTSVITAGYCMWNSTLYLGQALAFLGDLSQAMAAAESIFEILDYESVIDSSKTTGLKLDNIKGEIELSQVHFSYPLRPNVKILNNLSLKIPAGKTIAICGGSGGGKSTIIQLIQRLYDPIEGKVTLDGVDLKDLNVNWLRNQIALVSQEPILFPKTIRENIRMGRLNATDEECEEAAKLANIHSFIVNNLKDGYDTYVGERGSQLSGGQKQRISIARALIRNTKILLLDEATSALDFESEREVQEALDSAKIGRTTIIIAHRLSTIRNADLIIALKKGEVVEMGNHNELMAKKGVYYDLAVKSLMEIHNLEDTHFDSNDLNEATKLKIYEDKVEVEESKITIKERLLDFYVVQKFLWSFHLRDMVYIIIGIICQIINGVSVVAVLLAVVQMLIIATIMDPVEQRNQSYLYGSILLAIALVNFIFNIISSFVFSLCGARLTKKIRIKLFESMLNQEIAWHDQSTNQSSILCMDLENNASLCKGVTTDLICILSRAISSVGVALIVALVLNWKHTLVVLIFVPIIFLTGFIYGQMKFNTTNYGKKQQDSGKLLIDCIDQIRTIVSLCREDYFINEFETAFGHVNPLKSKELYKRAFFYAASNSATSFGMATNFSFGYSLIKINELPVINLYRIYETIMLLSIFLGRDAALLTSTSKAFKSAKKSFNIITRKPVIDSMDPSGIKIDNFKGSIEFRDVHFKYPTRPNVKILNGLNLKINENEMTGIVGKSGCGKSTVVQLLLRFYDVDEGSITLDGVDIRELNINWLRSQIGLVSQEPGLFDTTIFENIKYGICSDAEVVENDIINAAIKANIHERIENFPMKYETSVGNKGLQISTGEKQRIAIARAIIREPRILLLDEATSALDTESEKLVQVGLDNARLNRTCICIAHRLSTIQSANKICVFENGIVLEEGTHDELMRNAKLYLKFQRSNSVF